MDYKINVDKQKIYENELLQWENIAVIGVGIKVSNAETLEEYWSIFENQIDCIRDFPSDRRKQVENYAKIFPMTGADVAFNKGTYLEEIDEFDYPFFRITPREAELMEPAHRIILQTIYNTIVDAGYTRNTIAGTKTGVFLGYTAGSFKDNYLVNISFRYPELLKYGITANMPALMPSRISQMLDLHGPTMILDTACSSSLLAVHLACESILNGASEMAVAGGIKLNLLPLVAKDLKLGIESADDRTRAFDNGASGTGIGEGAFCVLLKPLKKAEQDGDHIYGVIKSSATNHDGMASGLTAPNPSAQTEVIEKALERANISAEDISYVEVHGTATILGDPIEFQGLSHAYRKYTNRKQFCGLSASKSNLGHLYESAGIAALVKALAALGNKKIPGSKYFNTPNLKINFSDSPFYVNKFTKPWKVPEGKKRTCGVSAFGLSGTNCHLILQEYCNKKESKISNRRQDLLCLSAFSKESLQILVKKYKEYIYKSKENLDNIVYNMNVNRQHYKERIAIVFSGKDDLLNKLKEYEGGNRNSEGFVFYSLDKRIENRKKEITEICVECNKSLKQSKQDEKSEKVLLEMLCRLGRLYVEGNEINWNALYRGMEANKLSMPAYPFQKYHMWLKENETKVLKQKLEIKPDNAEIIEPCTPEPILYQKIYLSEPLNKNAQNDNVGSMKDILVIQCGNASTDDVLKGFKNIGRETQVLKIHVDRYNVEEVFMRQLSVIDFAELSKVVVCFGSHRNENQIIAIDEDIILNMLAIICLYRCIEQDISDGDMLQIYCVTKNGFYLNEQKNETKPEFACIVGVCKAFNRGSKKIKALCIDIDNETKYENILDEIMSNNSNDIVFYRNNIRYIEGIQELSGQTRKKMVYRKKGVYLITGGLGGIGFETAKELLKRAEDSTIVLIGKTELPSEETWDNVISSGNSEIAEKLKKLIEVQKYNKVVYLACDVSKQEQVISAVHTIQSTYGPLNGIVHTAGMGGGTDFEGLNEARVKRMVSAKVVGAYALDQATANEKLDFFVVFSSISTVFSSADLPDYIAANMFLEEFALWRAQKREGISLAIEWSTWAEIGMSVKNNFAIDTMFKTIKTKEGMELLFTSIDSGYSNVIAGQLNYESKIILLINKYPVHLSDYIVERLNGVKSEINNTIMCTNSENSKKQSSYAEIENYLCEVCCKVLGYSTINITDNFFELGADSILLSRIFDEINTIYPNQLNITDLFTYPTVELLTEYLDSKIENLVEKSEKREGQILAQQTDAYEEEISDKDIAIIGVGMNLPNASNLDEYWQILNNGINVVREIPYDRSEDIVKHLRLIGMKDSEIKFNKCGYLDRINSFDNAYFGMSPKESSLIEPAGRMFLQACATAIEDAGYGGDSIRRTQTGVFLGYTANIGNAYSRLLYEADQELFGESMPVNQISMMASRIAYVYDLRGPSMVIDTACSSSLVALHTACKQIRSGECDMALAGGVSIMMTPLANGANIGFESPEYKTRAFADNSSGTAVGEGVCAILLKPLKTAKKDGDSIYAVIKGSAINQDGRSQGIAAPNYLAQSAAITKAWEDAGVTGQDITYIEAHGTGTQLGDAIEIKGIMHAFSSTVTPLQSCGIGSLKTNIGHLNEASGISGILKIILMMRHKIIPASLEFKTPNSNIDFAESPVYVVSRKMPLKPKSNKINIGINGFGMSGTNCHVILCDPPAVGMKRDIRNDYIFTASAKTKSAFLNIVGEYLAFLEENQKISLADFCYTANVGRTHFQYRFAVYVHTRDELIKRLRDVQDNYIDNPNKIADYIGNYNIIPENKMKRATNEITSRMQKQMTMQAGALVESIKNTGCYIKASELVSLYIKGADVNWSDLYVKEKYNRIHIPVYPFEKLHCWYKIPMPETEPVFHYEKNWVHFGESKVKELSTTDYTLVFIGKSEHFKDLPNKLEENGVKVCVVTCGDAYEKIDEEKYSVRNTVDDYTKLFNDLKNKSISRVIHLKAIYTNQAESDTKIQDRLDNGFFDIINIMKGMAKARFHSKFDFIFIANSAYKIKGDEKLLLPENATLLSIGTVIEQENPNINCYAIDIDMLSDSNSICELFMRMDRTYLYGIRSNKIFQMEAKASELPKIKEEVIKFGQVYLITGGTGGIGVEIANYISKMNLAIIVLLSKSGFEAQENWKILKLDSKYARQIEIFEEIQRRGSVLCFEKCDVSKKDELAQCIERIHQKYGKIKGVFHAAGISGAGYILRKEKESFIEVIKPKLYGTVYLDALTMDDKLDFMMLCSSAVTDSGEAGQSDYVAANAFLDAYTDYRNLQGRATYTVNWVSWKEVGMAVRHGINVDGVTKALTTKEAIEALDKVLKSTPKRVMIGQYNKDMDLAVFAQYCRYKTAYTFTGDASERKQSGNTKTDINLFSDGSRNIAKVINGKMMFIPKSDKMPTALKANVKVKLIGDEKGDYTEFEYKVGNIYGKTLGYEEINVYDNFFELGGDSIMLSGMFDLLCAEFDEVITVADLFEYTNIRDLAKLIQKNFPEKNVTEQVDDGEVGKKQIETVFPLSMSQQRIYYDSRLNKDKLAYNNSFLCDLTGLQDNSDILDIVNAIVERHEILRARLVVSHGHLMQKVDEIPNVKINMVVVESIYNTDYKKYLKQFDLMKDWLFHLTLFKDKENHLMLLFDVHHILLDGYASGLLQSEMLDYYMRHSFEAPAVQYREYVDYEQRFMKSEDYKKLKGYWLKKLSGYEPAAYFSRNRGLERKQGYYTKALDESFASEIRKIAGAMGQTTFSLFLSVINLLVSVLWQMDDNVFLIPVMNRNRPQFKKMLGVIVNLIPVRSRIDNELLVREEIQSIFIGLQEDLEHQSYQYNDLITSLNEQNTYAKFNMYIDFEDESLKSLKSSDLAFKLEQLKYDLDIVIKKRNGLFDVEIAYDSSIFLHEDIVLLASNIKNVLYLIKDAVDTELKIVELKKKILENIYVSKEYIESKRGL